MRFAPLLALFTLLPALAASPEPAPAPTGKLELIEKFASPQLGNTRTLRLYLPPGYATNPERRYPVLYMHDGQNLYDPKLSYSGVPWGVDKTIDTLIHKGEMQPVIVVGIDNTPERMAEYSPDADPQHKGGKGDAYADFVIKTIKPYIDSHYRTLPDKANTVVMGSSMGGLVSFHIAMRYPDVVGSAASLSGSFWWNGGAMIKAVQARKTRWPVRLYLDAGTGNDGLLDSARMLSALVRAGYELGDDLHYVAVPGADHHERAWAARLAEPLSWLFPPPTRPARP
ncbi:alpha/beta hydrolase [Chitinimonas sp. BJYL2]|uniref:alpha/beta hydrolase n=1 Tax=Chitinimonas sp. BJYL2 TaxID=2976696 RepID=UPI0022B3E33D|nr:alpha/beta hydrolase-fold protein [Chitinimonas sp. BJYL2]